MTTPTATGGFVTRSERQTASPLRTATGQLGPGGYDVDQPKQVSPAPVPFATSKERDLLANTTTSALTPGVGAYEAAMAHDLVRTKHIAPVGPTANFAAGVPRMHEDRSTRTLVPGPGAYPEPNGWVKKSPHYNAPAAAQRVLFVRVPSAPSIPAGHQAFGYEEGEGGVLVMQKASDPVHTGRDGDTVGPGSYNPSPTGRKKATAWANSKTKRGLEFKSIAPGPGAYNPSKPAAKSHSSPVVVTINGVEVQFGGTAGTAQFVSKVPLWSQKQPSEHERTPGPGAYAEGLSIAAKAQPLPEELQCFNSTAKRHSSIDPMKSLSAPTYFRNPGPGAYEDPRRSISLNVQPYVDPLPFASTGSRFQKSENGLPGPGDYKPEEAVSLLKAAQQRAAVSKSGVFGTLAPRFPSRAEMDAAAAPGPGNYQPRLEPSPPRHRGEASVFQSKTARFRAATAPVASLEVRRNMIAGKDDPPHGDPTNLGPGCYAAPDLWSSKNRHPGFKSTAFGSDAGRASAAATTASPGPGRYRQDVDVNKVYKPYTNPAKETVFGSQTSRFKAPSSFTPGPGQYIAQGEFVRKSYNITYGGSMPEAMTA